MRGPGQRLRTSSLALQPVTHNLEYRGPNVGPWHKGQITPISDHLAVAGPERDLVIRELSRLRKSVGQQRRRTTAILGALATLVILGATVWLVVESVYALTDTDQNAHLDRWVIALVQIVLYAICLLCATLVLFYFRSRKPTTASRLVLPLAGTACTLQLLLAILDFALIGAWRRQVHRQCESWRVDVVWMDRNTCPRQGTSLSGFLIAAGIRLLVVLIVSALWLSLMRQFAKMLKDSPTRPVDIDLVQSTEVQQILDRHSAEVIPIQPSHVLHSVTADGDEADLPPMPERAQLLSQQDEAGRHRRDPSAAKTQKQGWLWSATAWLFGVGHDDDDASNDEDRHSVDLEKKPPHRATSTPPPMPEDPPAISQNFRGTPSPARFQQQQQHQSDLRPLFNPEEGGDASTRTTTTSSSTGSSSFGHLFGFGRSTPVDTLATASSSSSPSPPRDSSESQDTLHPLPRESDESNVKKPLVSPYETSEDYSERLRASSSASSEPSHCYGYEHERQTDSGANNSSNTPASAPPAFQDRQMIYVQMSDGRLVHRLSTIGERSTTTAGDRSTLMGGLSEDGASSVRSTTPSTSLEPQLPGALPPS